MAHYAERFQREDLEFDFDKAIVSGGFVEEVVEKIKKCQEEAVLSQICTLPRFQAAEVIFNEPATIILWKDGTKTVVKCSEEDVYSPEVGVALCYMKKLFNNKGNYNNLLRAAAEQYYSYEDLDDARSSLHDSLMVLCKAIDEGVKTAKQVYNNYDGDDEKKIIYASSDYKQELCSKLDFAVEATGQSNTYAIAYSNGLLYAKSLIDGEEPDFYHLKANEHSAYSALERVKQSLETMFHKEDGDDDVSKAFRNACRYIWNAIDGREPDFELIESKKTHNTKSLEELAKIRSEKEISNGKTSVEECSTVDTVSEDKTSDGADVSGRLETVD